MTDLVLGAGDLPASDHAAVDALPDEKAQGEALPRCDDLAHHEGGQALLLGQARVLARATDRCQRREHAKAVPADDTGHLSAQGFGFGATEGLHGHPMGGERRQGPRETRQHDGQENTHGDPW